eukprot:5386843-Amphidinium_carterae.1
MSDDLVKFRLGVEHIDDIDYDPRVNLAHHYVHFCMGSPHSDNLCALKRVFAHNPSDEHVNIFVELKDLPLLPKQVTWFWDELNC